MVREGSRREGRGKYKEKQNMHKRGMSDQKREREKNRVKCMFIQGFFYEIKSVIFSLNVLDCYL